jgi:nicotinamidase-related amidase
MSTTYEERGFGHRQGGGRRPCLVVVDFSLGFTDPESPLHCDADAAVDACARLLDAARGSGTPVLFTTVEYDAAGLQTAGAFVAKSPALANLREGSRWVEIDPRLAPDPSEPVLPKLWASAFFGTALQTILVARGCDSVVLAGASTSGCVRATAVDAVQHGYLVSVCGDAVADRMQSAHDATLADVDAKYGDVVGLDEAIQLLGQGA